MWPLISETIFSQALMLKAFLPLMNPSTYTPSGYSYLCNSAQKIMTLHNNLTIKCIPLETIQDVYICCIPWHHTKQKIFSHNALHVHLRAPHLRIILLYNNLDSSVYIKLRLLDEMDWAFHVHVVFRYIGSCYFANAMRESKWREVEKVKRWIWREE